jgi:hypothetical protein
MPSLKPITQTAIPMTPTLPRALLRYQRPTPSLGPLQSVSGMTVTCASHPVRLLVQTDLLAAQQAGGRPVVSVAEERNSGAPLPVSIVKGGGARKVPKELKQMSIRLLLLRRQVLADLDLRDLKWVAMVTFHISTAKDISEHRSIGSCGGGPEDRSAVTPNLKWIEEYPSISLLSGVL